MCLETGFSTEKCQSTEYFFHHIEPSQSPPQPAAVLTNLREDACTELTVL